MSFTQRITRNFISWLLVDRKKNNPVHHDFEKLKYFLQPGDIILIQGSSRIGKIIQFITRSQWSHTALYLGEIHTISHKKLSTFITNNPKLKTDSSQIYVIESLLGRGVVLTALDFYHHYTLKIRRARDLSDTTQQIIIEDTLNNLGDTYTLSKQSCSAIIANAFKTAKVPIVEKAHLKISRLLPADFDSSPFLETIYPK